MFCELVTGTHEKGVQGKEGRGGSLLSCDYLTLL